MNRGLTAEAAAQLQGVINLVLSRWAALRMAVERSGAAVTLQKSQQLGPQLFHILAQSKVKIYIDDLEDMLDEFMLSLNTEIEDCSIEEIAEKLMAMHEECLEGNFDSIKTLKETNTPSVSYIRQPSSNDGEDSDDDGDGDGDDMWKACDSSEMEVDVPQCRSNLNEKASMIDDTEVADRWTVVTSRRNRGRKN